MNDDRQSHGVLCVRSQIRDHEFEDKIGKSGLEWYNTASTSASSVTATVSP